MVALTPRRMRAATPILFLATDAVPCDLPPVDAPSEPDAARVGRVIEALVAPRALTLLRATDRERGIVAREHRGEAP